MATYLTESAIPLTTSPNANVIANGSNSTYPIYGAFDRNITTGWTSAVANTGWLGYNFQRDITIYKYALTVFNTQYAPMPKNWTFEGSNDGTTWTVIDTRSNISNWSAGVTRQEFTITTPTKFKQYRINVTAIVTAGGNVIVGELEMYEMVLNNKILISLNNDYIAPTQGEFTNANKISTNQNDFVGVVTSSTPASGYEAWKLFDGDLGTRFPNTGTTAWVIYDFKVPTQVDKYRIGSVNTSVGASGGSPKDWTLEGSNDGTNWNIIDTQSNVDVWGQGEYKEYQINANYTMYKLNITAKSSGAAALAFAAFDLIKRVDGTVVYVPELNEQHFTHYGLDKSTSLDLKESYNKLAFVTNSTTLGSGKVFRKSIDTSKVLIKGASIK